MPMGVTQAAVATLLALVDRGVPSYAEVVSCPLVRKPSDAAPGLQGGVAVTLGSVRPGTGTSPTAIVTVRSATSLNGLNGGGVPAKRSPP